MKKSKQLIMGLATLVALQFSGYFGQGDVVIEDFETERDYPPCCQEYGAYYSFKSNLTQNGSSGTLVIGGDASDWGGFYRDQGGPALWDLRAQTNLVLTAKRLPDNTASNCFIVFRDARSRYITFSFALEALPTNGFGTIVKPLQSPDWSEASEFDFARVTAMDIHGGFSSENLAFRVELAEVKAIGPAIVVGPTLEWSIATNTLVLDWDASVVTNFQLLSAPSPLGAWSEETNVDVVGTTAFFSQPLTGISKFFQVLPVAEAGAMAANAPITGLDALSGRGTTSANGDEEEDRGAPVSAQSGGAPPPVGEPIFYTNYIDVALYVGVSTNNRFGYFPGFIRDYENGYQKTYSSHTGGSASYVSVLFTNHVASTNGEFPAWVRAGDESEIFTFGDYWAKGETNWPNGTRTESGYNAVLGQADPPYEIPPPAIPWAKINGLTAVHVPEWTHNWHSGWTGNVYRADETLIDLHTGAHISNYWYKFVKLAASAQAVGGVTVGLNDPVHPDNIDGTLVVLTNLSPLSWSNIALLESSLNADGAIFKQVEALSVTDVTPVISGADNYLFDVSLAEHSLVNLSMSRHPRFDLRPLARQIPDVVEVQEAFNEGSLFLGLDDDEKIPDSDPSTEWSTNAASVYRSDDVPAYVEFMIANGPLVTNTFTRQSAPVFPEELSDEKYYDIRSEEDVTTLLDWTGANIKIVSTIFYNGSSKNGVARLGSSPASIVVNEALDKGTLLHEWGHTRGLYHRGVVENEIEMNPGPLQGALMSAPSDAPYAINRFEQSYLDY